MSILVVLEMQPYKYVIILLQHLRFSLYLWPLLVLSGKDIMVRFFGLGFFVFFGNSYFSFL